MKYLISGAVTFLIFIVSIFLTSTFRASPAPNWWLNLESLLAVAYISFGMLTIVCEKKYAAGILFFILAVIALLTREIGTVTSW